MTTSNAITQKRYSIGDAIKSVPVKELKRVKCEVMAILGIKSGVQLFRYSKGAMPTLAQAKAAEEYFLTHWGITDVWKEVTEKTTDL